MFPDIFEPLFLWVRKFPQNFPTNFQTIVPAENQKKVTELPQERRENKTITRIIIFDLIKGDYSYSFQGSSE